MMGGIGCRSGWGSVVVVQMREHAKTGSDDDASQPYNPRETDRKAGDSRESRYRRRHGPTGWDSSDNTMSRTTPIVHTETEGQGYRSRSMGRGCRAVGKEHRTRNRIA